MKEKKENKKPNDKEMNQDELQDVAGGNIGCTAEFYTDENGGMHYNTGWNPQLPAIKLPPLITHRPDEPSPS